MEDELDSDLYDRVSYLNLMDKIDSRKKPQKVGKFRDDEPPKIQEAFNAEVPQHKKRSLNEEVREERHTQKSRR
uniref:IK cytokine n=1 Tax=Caenorhabditis tropicalis TaxID=1561998 RepID=A0A1I7TJN7_9PELO